MRFASIAVMVFMLAACGGEQPDTDLASSTQATTGSTSYNKNIAPIYHDYYGGVGTGLWISPRQVLINRYHYLIGMPGWTHSFPNFLRAYDRNNTTGWVIASPDACEIKYFNGIGVWGICPAISNSSADYYDGNTYVYPESTATVYGSAQTCNSGTTGTDSSGWVRETSAYAAINSATVSGITNIGNEPMCAPPYTPVDNSAYCYRFNVGTTCMYGDYGAPQFKYDTYLIGLGFGNMLAAWATSSVISWIDAERVFPEDPPGGGGPP